MQKYIFITLIIIVNIISVFLLFQKKTQTIYSEEIVYKASADVNNELNTFLKSVYSEIDSIKQLFKIDNNFSQKELDNFFINSSNINPSLYSLFIKKANLFYIVNREENTLKSAFDTLGSFNIVKWNRFKDNKFVTSWTEVVQLDSVAIELLNPTKKTENNILIWNVGDGKNIEGNNFLVCSIKTEINNNEYIIIFRFNKDAVNVFNNKILNSNKNIYLLKKDNNNYIKFTKDTLLNLTSKSLTDSSLIFEKNIIEYSKKLNKLNDSIFSFTYNDSLFWTINLNIDPKYGIEYFTLTIPDSVIKDTNINILTYIIIYIIFLIISVLLILYLLKIIKLKSHTTNFDTNDILLNLLKNDESRYLEFKSSLRWDFRQEKVNPDLENVILKTIAAFGNSDGGVLLIGVSDDKSIIGLDKDYTSLKQYGADFFEIYLRNILHKHMGVKYVTENIRITFHKFDNKEICKIEIFKASEPLYLTINKKGNISEKFYVRSGNSSNELNSLKDINDYIFNRFKK